MSFAISGHLDRLLSSQAGVPSQANPRAGALAPERATHGLDASGSRTPATGLSAVLGRLGVERGEPTASSEATTPPMKPNLDALNRVLNHYAAQSAGVDSIISLIKP